MLKSTTFALFLATALNGHAVPLTFAPSDQAVLLGDQVAVDLVLSDLGAGTAPSLGGFDIDVSWDDAILSLGGVVFGLDLGDDLFFEAFYEATAAAAAVSLVGLSFLFDFELDALQGDTVVIATLMFDTVGSGTSALTVDGAILSDAFGDALALTSAPDGSVTVGAAVAVAEPGGMVLLIAGWLALAALRRPERWSVRPQWSR